MSIALLDQRSNLVTMPYYLEHGERFPVDPFPLGVGLTGHVLQDTRAAGHQRQLHRSARLRYGAKPIGDLADADMGKSYLGVPILSGDRGARRHRTVRARRECSSTSRASDC